MDLFDYETGTTSLGLSINSEEPIVGAAVTAIINNSGQVSAITIINGGSGYVQGSNPVIKFTAPSGIGFTAVGGTLVGASGTIGFASITTVGSGYTNTNPPQCIIEKPPFKYENLTTPSAGSLSFQNNSGSITGIGTTILSSKLAIKFTVKRDGSLSDFNPIAIGNPIYVFDTRVGSGVIGIDTHGNNNNSVGIGTSFADSIYSVAAFQDSGSGVGIITCLIKSDTNVSGMISSGSIVGKYSVGKISGFSRGSNAISIGVTGFTVDLVQSIGISTYPTLRRTGGPKTFEQTGSIIPEIRPT
mgnify:FL=1